VTGLQGKNKEDVFPGVSLKWLMMGIIFIGNVMIALELDMILAMPKNQKMESAEPKSIHVIIR
jgi:hypothetical protein